MLLNATLKEDSKVLLPPLLAPLLPSHSRSATQKKFCVANILPFESKPKPQAAFVFAVLIMFQ